MEIYTANPAQADTFAGAILILKCLYRPVGAGEGLPCLLWGLKFYSGHDGFV